jgi:glyoxylase-like metal-dependent hydrolase (beta-lactamase superfamily II)
VAAVTYKVTVLKPGFLKRDRFGSILDARSTVTLISGNDLNIIVDTGTSEEKQDILTSLRANGLVPEDINILINTHSHPDHSGNNDLFVNAKFIGHRKEYWGLIAQDKCEILRKDTEIAAEITIVETPGHTVGSTTIFLTGTISDLPSTTIAISGDALPILDNYLKWVPPAINFDPNIALQSMNKIVSMADIIIPGHDAAFRILDRAHRKAQYV